MSKKPIKYELILLFDWNKKLSTPDILKMLPKGFCSLRLLYYYKARYKKANKKAMKLMK